MLSEAKHQSRRREHVQRGALVDPSLRSGFFHNLGASYLTVGRLTPVDGG